MKPRRNLILRMITAAHPQGVQTRQLIDALYGHDSHGGANTARQIVCNEVRALRKAGYPIERGGPRRGYRLLKEA